MQSKWSPRQFRDEMEARVYTSRLIGSDPDLVLHGGGNTSLKRYEVDHAGREVYVLRVKGSGSDLASIEESGFTGLRMEDLLLARKRESMTDEEMMDYLRKSMLDPSEPSPSVETFLHAFIPHRFVDHSHADAILSITNTNLSERDVEGIFSNVLVVPYIPPGFRLARALLPLVENMSSSVRGIILSRHGLFTFGSTAEESYRRHIEIVDEAEKYLEERVGKDPLEVVHGEADPQPFLAALPTLRGSLSRSSKKVLFVDRSEEAVRISRSRQAEAFEHSGPATPDMLIRTKYDYLYIRDPGEIPGSVDAFASRYREEWQRYVKGYPMHDPYPTAIVVRGFGIITAGTSLKEARIVRDQVVHSILVNSRAEKLAGHRFISREEAYAMEYWPLEEAKLRKYRPKMLQGSVALVTGAASGIGLEAARKLAGAGALVVACDLDSSIDDVARNLSAETQGYVVPYRVDLSKPQEIEEMFRFIVSNYGGIDAVFNNAGILKSAPIDEITVEDMDRHYQVNARAMFLVAREAFKVMKQQGIGGNIVFNITKNLTHPGPGMAAYGSTKAFAAHICHYVAREGGRYGIRANIINPDKVFRGSKIWENGVLEARAKAKGQTVEEYKTQNLLHREVLPEHVANVLLALLDESTFGVTTDAMIPVDGGVM